MKLIVNMTAKLQSHPEHSGLAFKGTVGVISRDHLFRKWHVGFTMVPLNPPSEYNEADFVIF